MREGEVGQVMRGGHRSLLLPISFAVMLTLVGVLAFVGSRAGAPPDDDVVASGSSTAPGQTAENVADAFLAAWSAEDWTALQALVADPSLDAGGVHAEAHRILRVEGTTAVAGAVQRDGERATVPAEVTWDLGELGMSTFSIEVPLARTEEGWRVRWWYPVVHPDLTPERRFQRVRVFRDRAPILGADDVPLVATASQMVVEVDRARVEDADALAAELVALTGADPALVEAALRGQGDGADEGDGADGADDDVEGVPADDLARVAVLDVEAFEEIRVELAAVPGVTFRRTSARVEAVPGLGALLGSVGEITAEGLDTLGPAYRIGDVVGRSGLERAQEIRLAGEPQQEARIVERGQLVTTLAFLDGATPEPIRVTIDGGVQAAARAALDRTALPAALVAIDIPSGAIRAAASTPDGELQRALEGRYPPGSTFKIVTAAAALAEGRTPESEVDCPPVGDFGGRELRNAGGDGPGVITFLDAMARSCNTAFATLAEEVGGEALAATAERFGFDVAYEVGLPVTGGTYPATAGLGELAGAAIGQGQVEASPVHMASVAAAAVSGTWRSPHLLDGVEVVERSLPAQVVEPLRALLRAAVAEGTGRAADLPGVPVLGKTGSAEFGTGPQLETHAWFIAARGDLALAVIVEGGGGGGAFAAPIAATFLASLEG